jgi:hypothetical protein
MAKIVPTIDKVRCAESPNPTPASVVAQCVAIDLNLTRCAPSTQRHSADTLS